MAQKKASDSARTAKKRAPKPGRKRYRRTEAELIEDLEKKIEALKKRQGARKLRKDPSFKAAMQAARSLVKAEQLCRKADYVKLANALKAAHLSLKPHLKLDEYVDKIDPDALLIQLK